MMIIVMVRTQNDNLMGQNMCHNEVQVNIITIE